MRGDVAIVNPSDRACLGEEEDQLSPVATNLIEQGFSTRARPSAWKPARGFAVPAARAERARRRRTGRAASHLSRIGMGQLLHPGWCRRAARRGAVPAELRPPVGGALSRPALPKAARRTALSRVSRSSTLWAPLRPYATGESGHLDTLALSWLAVGVDGKCRQ